jgi:hypothetical protein
MAKNIEIDTKAVADSKMPPAGGTGSTRLPD